jgi:hypothetical protein
MVLGCSPQAERGDRLLQMAELAKKFGDTYATASESDLKSVGFAKRRVPLLEDENDDQSIVYVRRFVNDDFNHETILSFRKPSTFCTGLNVFSDGALPNLLVAKLIEVLQQSRGPATIKKSLPRSPNDGLRSAITLSWAGAASTTYLHIRPSDVAGMTEVLLGLEAKEQNRCERNGTQILRPKNMNPAFKPDDLLPIELNWLESTVLR